MASTSRQPVGNREEPFALRRLGLVMSPRDGDPLEVEGAFNPAAARGPDGELYLFPRLVSAGNYSRIGIARVRFSADGDPVGVERLGIALEPGEPYEKNPWTGGGCEDPRVTYLEPFHCYLMTYTAYSPEGPRIALAASTDLITWERLGLACFTRMGAVDFTDIDNKDALVFPRFIPDPRDGVPSVGFIHRPLFEQERFSPSSAMSPLERASMWISYCHQPATLEHLCGLHSHHRLMSPRADWERTKIGGGVPPVLTRHGWLVMYHGVSPDAGNPSHFRYAAGALILDADHPERICYRSKRPVLTPDAEPLIARGANFVFPTAADCRDDIGQPDRIDVYYGIADRSIGVASLTVPAYLDTVAEGSDELRDDLTFGWGPVATKPQTNKQERETAMVKDPVCGMEVDPEKSQHKSEYAGTIYHFCSGGCKRAFDAEPSKYTSPAM
ncbi:MAG: YHS domain-containing protein [Chloroflexota bacterium]|nr:YHS domain-containing protein [Chloroflexota bacterium]